MKKIFALIGVIGLISVALPLSAGAVEYGGLGGRPAQPREDNPRSQSIFIREMKPGTSVNESIRLFNNSGETKTIKLGSVDSAPSSDGAFACSQESEPKNDIGSWITFTKDMVTLANGEETVVDFTITAPASASVGEHGGCVTMQDTSQKPVADRGGVVLSFRSAIRVAVTIPGDIVKAISFTGIDVRRSSSNAALYRIQPSVINTGNVSLDTALDVRLVSLFGTSVASQQATYPVLPATTARWNFDVDQPFWGGWYRAEAIAEFNSNVADTIGEGGTGERVSTRTQSNLIFIMPTPLAAIIELVVLLVFVGALTLLVAKLRRRRDVKNNWLSHTVKKGETLESIAEHHHISWKKLAQANHIKAPYDLSSRHSLQVPKTVKKRK